MEELSEKTKKPPGTDASDIPAWEKEYRQMVFEEDNFLDAEAKPRLAAAPRLDNHY